MISRRTTIYIAKLYVKCFQHSRKNRASNATGYSIDGNEIYDFLFEHDYEPWFCTLGSFTASTTETRKLMDFILGLHTGESIIMHTGDWREPNRTQLGQKLLVKLAGDILERTDYNPPAYLPATLKSQRDTLVHSLLLDGYKYQNSRLLTPESEVFDTQESTDVLSTLYKELGLENNATAFHHLKKSEERYLAGEWGDCISNSRNFLEAVLQEVAASYSLTFKHIKLADKTYEKAVLIRDYLEAEGILDTKEKQTLSAVYGLLSDTGSHPYMAQQDQARLLRHMSLLLSEFIMLRYQGRLAEPSK